MDLDERELALNDIREEINIVLSIKNFISEEEMKSFREGFPMFTEMEIREQLVEITGDSSYIDNYDFQEEILQSNEKVIKNTCVLEQSEITETLDANKVEENLKAENITVIREEVKYNQLCIEWDWPVGVNKALVCYRNDKFPLKPEEKDCYKFTVEKGFQEKTGEFIINKLKDESYYFWVFPIIFENGDMKYLEGKKRLVVNKAVGQIYYELKVKKNLLRQVKSVKILLKTNEEELTLPPTVLVAKKGSVPIFKSDGNEIYRLDYTVIGKAKSVEIEVPQESIIKNTYIKLFIEDEKSSTLFRIIPPKKEQMYV
ncbi:MAG: hypothetical protein H7Y18_11840 [Clostridiaceae bacterium]|nr:hypothetical protein [Clostridiaceae bacterium]